MSARRLQNGFRRVYREAVRTCVGVNPQAAAIMLIAATILVLSRNYCTVAAFNRHWSSAFAQSEWRPMLAYLYWFSASFVAQMLLPYLLLRRFFKLTHNDLGLGLGDWRVGTRVCLSLYVFMFVCLLVAVQSSTFTKTYPLSSFAAQKGIDFLLGKPQGSLSALLVYEMSYAFYFIGWEFFFRGFLTIVLARYIGPLAIFVQTIPFALLHVGKPPLEALGSVVAGVALGILALRTKSIWWGVFLHVAIALSMDALVLLVRAQILF